MVSDEAREDDHRVVFLSFFRRLCVTNLLGLGRELPKSIDSDERFTGSTSLPCGCEGYCTPPDKTPNLFFLASYCHLSTASNLFLCNRLISRLVGLQTGDVPVGGAFKLLFGEDIPVFASSDESSASSKACLPADLAGHNLWNTNNWLIPGVP